MKIGIDAREVMGRPTGVGRYLAEVLSAWADPASGAAERHTFVLYGAEPLPAGLAARLAPLSPRTTVVPGRGGTWWEQVALAAAAGRDALDVFFAPAYTAPIRCRCPVALTIHDLSYFAHPEWFSAREGLRRRLLTRASARRAAVVLTVSDFSRSEIQSYLGLGGRRVRVIPHGAGIGPGADEAGPPGGEPAPPQRRDPLVLYVGSILNRRRIPDLIAAFRLVLDRVPLARLEIVGENRTYPYQDLQALCSASAGGDRIRLRSYVPERDLADAFGRASVFAFLSEYEGFGLPPLEALAQGVPPVLLDTPIAREVCGPAARYVPVGDVAAAAAAIVDLLTDPAARAQVLAQAGGVLARYTWAEAARLTLAALESAATHSDDSDSRSSAVGGRGGSHLSGGRTGEGQPSTDGNAPDRTHGRRSHETESPSD